MNFMIFCDFHFKHKHFYYSECPPLIAIQLPWMKIKEKFRKNWKEKPKKNSFSILSLMYDDLISNDVASEYYNNFIDEFRATDVLILYR